MRETAHSQAPAASAAPDPAPAPVQTPPPSGRGWAALAVLATGQFLVVLSTSIVNVALPSIGSGLALSGEGLAWIVNAYGLAFGALLLVGGRAADLLGRRRVLLAGLGCFAAGSVLAGVSSAAWLLIAARAVQGIGAAALAPAALALVTVLYPAGPARGRAFAVWGAVSGAGGAAGVLLGGLLTQALGWRAVFWGMVPVAVAVLAATAWAIPRDAPARGASGADVPGILTVTAGLVALVQGVTGASRSGWTSPAVLVPVAGGAVLLATFAVLERRAAAPLLPPRIFRIGTVTPANAAMALLGAVWVGMFFFLPLYQRQILGYGPLLTGVSQLPLALSNIAASSLTPRVAARFGARATLTSGLLLLAAGLLWFGRMPVDGTFTAGILGPSLLAGTGLGLAFVGLTDAALAGVGPGDSGIAGGLVNTTRQVGGAVGLAALSALAASATASTGDPHSAGATAEGYRLAFTAAGVLTLLNVLLITLALRRTTAAPATRPEPSSRPRPQPHRN